MRPSVRLASGLALLLSLPLLAAAAAVEADGWKHFGGAFTLEQSVPLQEILAEPAAHAGKTVRVEARVADVCTKRGCWMVLAGGDRLVRVTMKDYGFFVDTDSAGALADLEGTLLEKPADPETEAHYASEAARPELVPAGSGDRQYEFVATAVRLRR